MHSYTRVYRVSNISCLSLNCLQQSVSHSDVHKCMMWRWCWYYCWVWLWGRLLFFFWGVLNLFCTFFKRFKTVHGLRSNQTQAQHQYKRYCDWMSFSILLNLDVCSHLKQIKVWEKSMGTFLRCSTQKKIAHEILDTLYVYIFSSMDGVRYWFQIQYIW